MFGPKATGVQLDLSIYGVADCSDCHKCLRNRFVLKLMAHLTEDHKMTENESIHVAVKMIDRVFNQGSLGK
jgi:hypothetical protein